VVDPAAPIDASRLNHFRRFGIKRTVLFHLDEWLRSRFRAADVRSILAAGTGTPQPRSAGDALVLDLPTAPTRSLEAYKITATPDGSGA